MINSLQYCLSKIWKILIFFIIFINDFFIYETSFSISKISNPPCLWLHVHLFGMPHLVFIFGKSSPLKKMERKESMYVLNLSKRCEEFVLKWLINKSYIIFLEFQIYLTFLLLCPLQITFSYTVVGKNNSTKRGEMG